MDEVKKVVLLCGKDDCCPTVMVDKNQVVIEDDYNGKVKFTKEQFELLKTKIKNNEL